MRRIIRSSSNKGDMIMDPFCGCGTTIEAAQELGRKWIGIDISPFAIQLILKVRLGGRFPRLNKGKISSSMDCRRLSKAQHCCASRTRKLSKCGLLRRLTGFPTKEGSRQGIDGHIPFRGDDGKKKKYAVVSVKGGKLKADDIRSLAAVAKREQAKSMGFGVFISMHPLTKGMRTDAAAAGTKTVHGKSYPLIQHLTVEDILAGNGRACRYSTQRPLTRKRANRVSKMVSSLNRTASLNIHCAKYQHQAHGSFQHGI